MTLKKQYSEDEIPRILEMYEITKLDVNRIYRYLDKYMEKSDDASGYICGGGSIGCGGGAGGFGCENDNNYDSIIGE